MGDLYASPVGTTVIRSQCKIPRCPPQLAHIAIAVGPTEESEDELRDALCSRGHPAKGFEFLESYGFWKIEFGSRAKAHAAVKMASKKPLTLKTIVLPVTLRLWYNSRPYGERGWCIFESCVSTEAISRFSYYPRLIESLQALQPKLFDIDYDPRKAPVAHHAEAEQAGHKARIDRNRERLRAACFTTQADSEHVVSAYTKYVRRIANAVLNSGEVSTATYQGGVNDAGQPHGFGTKRWADGIEYTGSWQDGLKHGPSETTWPDGTIYMGSYKKGKKDGPFVVSRKDGVVFVGTYANGQRIGQGVLWSADRTASKLLQKVVEWHAATFERVQGGLISLEQAEAFLQRHGVSLPAARS